MKIGIRTTLTIFSAFAAIMVAPHGIVANALDFKMVPQGADAGNNTNIVISNDMRYFAYITDIFKVKLWSLDGKLVKTIDVPRVGMASLAFSPDGNILLILTRTKLYLYSTKGYLITTIGPPEDQPFPNFYGAPAFHPSGKFIAVGIYTNVNFQNMHAAAVYTLQGKQIKILKGFSNQISRCTYSPDGLHLAVLAMDKKINLYDKGGNLLRSITGYTGMENSMSFTGNGKMLVTGGFSGIKIANINGILLKTIQSTSGLMAISPDIDFTIRNEWGREGFHLIISDLDNRPLGKLENLPATAVCIKVAPNARHIFAALQSGLILIWNKANGEAAFLASKDKDWLMFTRDGYFASSTNGSKIVAMVKGLEAYGIDQFALRYNRPDLILQRLELGSPEQIAYYHHLYKKRLKKRGISEAQLLADVHVPEAKILDTKTEGKIASVTFELRDAKYNLQSFQIFVNDVPLFRSPGKIITGNKYRASTKIVLTQGDNKIEISCLNEKGVESYRALTYAAYTGKVTQDLYFLGFGVSEYKNKQLNLKYAHKDALDLEKLFQSFTGSYNQIHTKVFLNQAVTVETIQKAKTFVSNAKVDDTVILFIAGHGAHDFDEAATYYFLTSEVDLDNLRQTAAPFELVENLLQDIKPRNKLFLMDTCESGELQDETVTFYTAAAESQAIRPRSIRGLTIVNSSQNGKRPVLRVNRDFLLNKDRYIYNDIFRRSGAIVFSSSAGGEFSYEKDEIENGLFTEEIINTLKDSSSDLNRDQKISIDEMKKLVTLAVSRSSKNLQNPTVDRDNIYQKLYFPMP